MENTQLFASQVVIFVVQWKERNCLEDLGVGGRVLK